MAFDRLDYASASGHFSEMINLGQELKDPASIALGMVRQGDVLRKRGRYETALKCFEAAEPYADAADHSVRGIIWHVHTTFWEMSRNFSGQFIPP